MATTKIIGNDSDEDQFSYNNATNGSASSLTVLTSTDLNHTRFIVQKILVPIVVSCGVVGNIFNVVVLRSPKMLSSTNVYLMTLAISDSLYLLFSFSLSFTLCSNHSQSSIAFHYIPYGRVLTDLFANTAVLLTVCFTLERYIGVCHPMKGKAWCTVGKAKVAALITFGICIVNTIPELFEMEIVSMFDFEFQRSVYQCKYTEFAETDSYQIGYYWWYVTLFTFQPLFLLSIFNSLLIRSVWKASKTRRQLSHSSVVGDQGQSLEQQKVTTMLIAVVIIFIICQTPQAVLLVYRSYLKARNIPYAVDLFRIAGNICNLLVQINASSNFLLYSYFSSRFRRTFKKLLCNWQRPWKNASMRSLTFRKSTSTTGTTLSSNVSYRSRRAITDSTAKVENIETHDTVLNMPYECILVLNMPYECIVVLNMPYECIIVLNMPYESILVSDMPYECILVLNMPI
ncbi:hypothetical protein CHS0354_028546 [Potamilus streckersoni]|uniref:G-protein coupled receptors family 1 profile domain-containing protein n=1 Tax=Potamilus streckersoni TaxID=2493646 RepID=A0AAE0TIN1_9BIVA|nr:hypothetical protein CHS0354_028546 [Potamilus streckersoni]